MRKLINDENGFVVSAELVLVLTIAVLGMVVGLASFRDAVLGEFCDLSSAFGAIDQTYSVGLARKPHDVCGTTYHAKVSGFGFIDKGDDCDCIPLELCGVTPKTQVGGNGLNENGL
jgi:hypothetical protein